MQESLAAFSVEGFDHWAYESELHEGDPSPVAHTLAILEREGHTYRAGRGAVAAHAPSYGDDKDRVLVRSNGEHTYFASDIAYHQDKRERGFDRQIDVWGADHHGYVARMKAAYEALGGDPEHLELLIMQLVHLMRGGERAQMSKRAGEFVTLDDLLQEIGVDAARWYLLARSHETTVDLDLDLAREQSSENPVYYVQYAHARIAAVLAKAGEERVREALATRERIDERRMRGQAPLHAAERALIKQLLAFPARWRRRPSGGRRTGSRPTRSSWRRTSRPSTATAACRRRARGGRVAADRAVGGGAAHDRALPGPARGERAGGDVGARAGVESKPGLSRTAPGRRPGGRRRRARAAARRARCAACARARRRQRGSSTASVASSARNAASGTR